MTRRILLALVWLAGLITIVASSLTDEDPADPPVPVTVDFTIASLETPLSREVETRRVEIDDMLMGGRYDSTQGATLTLDRSSIELNNTSRFTVTVVAKTTDELLQGTADFDVTAPLDVGLDRNPTAGQFSTLFDGTTTLVSVTGSGVDTIIGDSMTTESYSWSDFSALEDDNDAALDLRMASAAYNMIEVVLRATLLLEDIITDVEDNKTVLEGMNLNQSLALACDNAAADGDGESVLFWTTDASGTGAGSIGDGDAFEARYENCRDTGRSHFLEGSVLLENYDPAGDTGFSIFNIDGDLRALFLADAQIDLSTTPADASPRYNGTLFLFYVELEQTL